jgi:hypothetical protein
LTSGRLLCDHSRIDGHTEEETAMGRVSTVVQGTLKPDGTLELDEKVNLPPGRVQVLVLQPVPTDPKDPFWERMEAIWAAQKARGHVPRSAEEIEAERTAMREEWEQHQRALEQIHRDAEQRRRQAGTGKEPPE